LALSRKYLCGSRPQFRWKVVEGFLHDLVEGFWLVLKLLQARTDLREPIAKRRSEHLKL
jgi:hypothetical protein